MKRNVPALSIGVLEQPTLVPKRVEDPVESDDFEEQRPRKVLRRTMSHVLIGEPAFPRSAYTGWQPTLTAISEREAIADLERSYYNQRDKVPACFNSFLLDDFRVYRPEHSRHGFELSAMDRLQNRDGFNEFLFDGTLIVGENKRYVQGVPFRTIAVDGYGDPEILTVHDRIYIQSPMAKTSNLWYRLGKPAQEYQRFYKPFLYLAQFTKFFIDYLIEREQSVAIDDFQSDFYRWMFLHYSTHKQLISWHSECDLKDFRTTVAANVGFLWKECWSIDDQSTGLCKHPIWSEIDPARLKAIRPRPNRQKKTLVTPLAYECFKRMYFSSHLDECNPSQAVLDRVNLRKRALQLTVFGALWRPDSAMRTPINLSEPDAIRVGDVVRVIADDTGAWETASAYYYAYVRALRGEALDVIWLYEPADTTLGQAYYPFLNELFFSDNCDCGNHAIPANCVVGKVDVTWFAKDPSSVRGLFVRQTYHTTHGEDDGYTFTSLRHADFQCRCTKQAHDDFEDCRRNYHVGHTVLVRVHNRQLDDDVLEVAQIIDFDLGQKQVILRRLRRRWKAGDFMSTPPNELLLTCETYNTSPVKIIRKCNVRFFDPKVVREGLPSPYDRGGAGDFYLIMNADARSAQGCQPGTADFPPIEQGWDPVKRPAYPKLKGLGIFCGGGNFDRGLEEGGAVEFRYAVDWAERALHSYRASCDKDRVEFFLGSVNDYLARAAAGDTTACIAQPGNVDFISAGSPCPGFSRLQLYRQSEESLQNASMVASVVSFVDFYSPKYCILENVVAMAHGRGTNKSENVFTQILAAFVALGYQVQQFLVDAWTVGSSQSRSRIFIVASAAGLPPWPVPPHTHDGSKLKRSRQYLGRSSNGIKYGERRDDVTPFEYVSAATATADLSPIGDALPQICPRFPDHRVPTEENSQTRALIAAVPVRPHGMGPVQAVMRNPNPGVLLDWYKRHQHNKTRVKPSSSSYSRTYPGALFPTVTTALRTSCGVTGRTLHWNEHRPLTVMELRRAQGFLDHEVVIGNPAQQVVIIGNSVDRKAALALGLSLRASWLQANEKQLQRVLECKNSARMGTNHAQTASDYDDGNALPASIAERQRPIAYVELTKRM